MKNKFVTTMLIMGGVISTLFFSSSTEEDTSQDSFEQEPPMPMQYKIQKLAAPLSTGETMVFRVDYFKDETLPNTIKIYTSGEIDVILKDDGNAPDIKAGDFEYATYLKTNPVKFVDLVQSYEHIINEKGSILDFNGHDGKVISAAEITNFDFEAFNNNESVVISESLVSAIDCSNNLKKENSLFITDIDVVEDPVRTSTNNVNVLGEYTLGHMLKNIINTPITGISVKNFIKSWLDTWAFDQTINGNTLIGRVDVNNELADIWLKAAFSLSNTTPPISQSDMWDQVNENDLLLAAPFKLTAIVNRIDLRGNFSYNNNLNNAGETRFIFTFIDKANKKSITGFNGIPMHQFPIPSSDYQSQGLDWKGCNIILEYSNVQKNMCDLQLFAKQWYDLSTLNRNTTNYRDALAAIVNTVTSANSNNNSANKTALARIRTNEKMFSHFSIGNPFYSGDWTPSIWELRQFEIGTDHLFQPVSVTNTPADLPSNTTINANFPELNFRESKNLTNVSEQIIDPVISWVMSSPVIRERVKRGNFNIPQNLLASSALLRQQLAEYYDFDLTANNVAGVSSYDLKEIRHQISLNRCQGCHGGETQTEFTQVRPMPIGNIDMPKYWELGNGTIGYIDEKLDPVKQQRIASSNNTGKITGVNNEKTYDEFMFKPTVGFTSTLINNFNRNIVVHNDYHQTVSPFLTGRRYMSNGKFDFNLKVFIGAPGWQDDLLSDVLIKENAPDNIMEGLFYVNDPSNQASGMVDPNDLSNFPMSNPPLESEIQAKENYKNQFNTKYGYNDLQRRKDDMCRLLSLCCNCGLSTSTSSSVPFELIKRLDFIPLPYASH